jgi:hypothetical protein
VGVAGGAAGRPSPPPPRARAVVVARRTPHLALAAAEDRPLSIRWASQRLIAAALGHHESGINVAMASLGGKPYLVECEPTY